MNMWELEFSAGSFMLDLAWLGTLLIAGMYLRNRLKIFQKNLIPANLIAGILGLLIGMNGLGWIDITTERLGVYIYHLLALLFIGLALRAPRKKLGITSIKTGMAFIITYLVQAIAGLAIAFLLIYFLYPDLFAGIGLLTPLAFGMNPGIAYTFGSNWELYGFESGGVVGLTFSAAGFLTAYTVGIWLVKKSISEGKAAYVTPDDVYSEELRTGLKQPNDRESAGKLTTSAESLESLSMHLGLVGLIYVFTYLIMKVMEFGLISAGAEQEVQTLWSFHFILAAVLAMLVRKIMDVINVSFIVDDITMTRISNVFMDVMIVASVAAISIAVVLAYWLPILLICGAAALGTWWIVRYLVHSSFSKYKAERLAAIFGNMTGTLQSGLLLLRIMDGSMKSPVSYNLVYGSGFALIFGLPLLMLLNVPVHYFDDPFRGFVVLFGVLVIYLVVLMAGWMYLKKSKAE